MWVGLGLGGTSRTVNGEGKALVRLGVMVDGEGVVQTMNGQGQELV